MIGDEDFIFGKKVIPFFRARTAAPVATTTLGLRSCTCARPKEVVVWYTNGAFGLWMVIWARVFDLCTRTEWLTFISYGSTLFPTGS